MSDPTILWFRRDLRLSDQAALIAACHEGPVVPVYVLDDETPRHRAMGAASRWWLHHSLASLDASLREKGSRLILRRGKADAVLSALAKETGAGRVHALHHYEPWWRNAEVAVGKALDLVLHDGNYLHPPGALKTGGGSPTKSSRPSGGRCGRSCRPRRLRAGRATFPHRANGRRVTNLRHGICCRPDRTGRRASPIIGHRARSVRATA